MKYINSKSLWYHISCVHTWLYDGIVWNNKTFHPSDHKL